MPLELIVNKAKKTIQSKSLMAALTGVGLVYAEFDKYRDFLVGKDVEWTSKQEDVTLSKCLQDLLDEKALSCYTNSRPEIKAEDRIFYPSAKNYITRYKWSVVKMNSTQLFWAQYGE